jgi:hypothetical protein
MSPQKVSDTTITAVHWFMWMETANFRLLLWFPQKISQVACGWRHTLALSEKKNVFSWGRGTSGQLGNGEIVDRWCSYPAHLVKIIFSLLSKALAYSSLCYLRSSGLTIHLTSPWRNTPVLIDALSPDGSGCKKLESSAAAPFAGLHRIML